MALSRRSTRTGRSRFTLVLLALTSITVLTLDFRGSGAVDDVRGVASTIFSPVRDAVSTAFSPVSNGWNGIFNYGDLEDENDALRARIDDLEGERVRNQDAAAQLEDLADLDDLTLTTEIPTVTARVSSGPISNFEHTVEIDKGSDDGIGEGMPVVNGAGLVGQVVQTTSSRSVVRLVTDPSFSFGVRLLSSGEVGIAHGGGKREPIVVDAGIDRQVDVPEAEPVMTSGLERSVFPPDIPVGEIDDVNPSGDLLSQELRVDPYADLDNLNYVRVLQWSGG